MAPEQCKRGSYSGKYGPQDLSHESTSPGQTASQALSAANLIAFPGGGHLSIEFTPHAPDADGPRYGAWLELRTEDPAAVLQAALDVGLTRVEHPGHPYYFIIPGGQVFALAPAG